MNNERAMRTKYPVRCERCLEEVNVVTSVQVGIDDTPWLCAACARVVADELIAAADEAEGM